MLYNTKNFVRALLAQDKYTQMVHLLKLKSGKGFFKSLVYTTKILIACRDPRFMNDSDRRELEQHAGDL